LDIRWGSRKTTVNQPFAVEKSPENQGNTNSWRPKGLGSPATPPLAGSSIRTVGLLTEFF